MPATPPQVSYDHGELTIVAQNSTIGDILHAVRDKMGIALDIPADATERVSGHMGPGSAKHVLAQLLRGSHFNYVILESAIDHDKLEGVILTLRPPLPPGNSVQVPAIAASRPQPGQSGGSGSSASASAADGREAPGYVNGSAINPTGPGFAGVTQPHNPNITSEDDVETADLVPEPGTLVLFGSGLIVLGLLTRRRFRTRATDSSGTSPD